MFFRFLIFFILFIILVRVISNLFLKDPNRKNSNARFFYQTFKNIREQQKNREYQQDGDEGKSVKSKLDNIEEAEYEDITEKNPKSSSNSN